MTPAVGHDRPAVLDDGADGDALLHPERLAAAAARVHSVAMAPPDVGPGSMVAVRVNEIIGVAGFILPGMRVDVLVTGRPPVGASTT